MVRPNVVTLPHGSDAPAPAPATKPRRVVVTGASGRLGQQLLPRLRARPGVGDIVALDVREPPSLPAGVRFVRADVRDHAIDAQLEGSDALVHLAFIVEHGGRDPAFVDSVNIDGSDNIVRAAARVGVDRVVYASSIAAYGFWPDNHGRLLDEDAPLRGNDEFYYSRTKREVERRLDAIEASHPEMAIARLRPTIFTTESIVFSVAGLMPCIVGTSAPVHLTHMDDVCDAFVLALEARLVGAYNVASEEPILPSRFAEAAGRRGLPVPWWLLAGAVGLAHRVGLGDVHPQWITMGAGQPILVNAERIRRAGWTPRYRTTAEVVRALADARAGRRAR